MVQTSGANWIGQRRHTLLFVDDEPDVLDSLRHQFHRNYRVLGCTSGKEAVEALENDQIDLILSDQRMPGMTGDQLLRRARELKPDTVRMLFTGYADIQAVISAVNEGHIFRYILKPWDSTELEGIIRQGVEQYDLLAERRRLISELQSTNAQLVRANQDLALAGKLKTAFIEVASHEFNTPINLVLGFTELLKLSSTKRTDQELEILRQITASGDQLAKLVSNMWTLLRAEDFGTRLKTAPVDLVELIRRMIDQVRPFLEARHLTLVTELDDDLGPFDLDADKISAVLINLITNAIKFTPDGGTIKLIARPAPDQNVEILVEDRGVGLDPEAVKHAFQPFFTELNPSRHSSGSFGFNKRGLGLGLSIAKSFVDMHGGTINIENREGGGTRITIRLPRLARSSEKS